MTTNLSLDNPHRDGLRRCRERQRLLGQADHATRVSHQNRGPWPLVVRIKLLHNQHARLQLVDANLELRRKHARRLKAQITADLTQLLKDVNAELPDYERLQMLVIAPEPWSIENGFLTPTMKIRRNRIEAAVETQLGNWYAGKGTVQWA